MKTKSFSRLAAGILIFTLLLGSTSVFAEAPSPWAQAEFDEAKSKGLVLPEADSNYQGYITRELFCKLIVNLVEQTTSTPVTITITNPFNDTNNTDIIKAHQLGIVNGTTLTTFDPDDLITREQVAAMMMRAARKLDQLMGHHLTMIQLVGSATFADTSEISPWALLDVREANHLGIMNGVGGNRIDPLGNTTVEQSILLILRVFNEYLPLMENAAPAPLPSATFEYDVLEGTSITINVADHVYDSDGDSMYIVGSGGNTTYGTWYQVAQGSFEYEFTAVMVDQNVDSVKSVTISDGVEQTQIEFTFHVVDEENSPPYGLMIFPFSVDEGETILIRTTDFARDPDGDSISIESFSLNPSSPAISGSAFIQELMVGNAINYTAYRVLEDTTVKLDVFVSDGKDTTKLTITINIINVNDPPVGNPITTLNQDEHTDKIYFGLNVATDPDGDTLEVTDFELSTLNQHIIGSGEIRNFDGAEYFYFMADEVPTATWTYYDLTVTDGIHEVIVTIRIQVDNTN